MNLVFSPGFNPIVCVIGGMHLILSVQLLAFSIPPAMTFSNQMGVSKANSVNSVLQAQGDSPDMSGREGVPPSAGSGSR
ncbi:MAG: hypothetical protein KME11_04555 [Timaviella obliquedivisa GSE-PSE-MK23-08B]|nr:hypothetical protein [Timaviella obliquedivisa GSE-PSE-MK23-08B]